MKKKLLNPKRLLWSKKYFFAGIILGVNLLNGLSAQTSEKNADPVSKLSIVPIQQRVNLQSLPEDTWMFSTQNETFERNRFIKTTKEQKENNKKYFSPSSQQYKTTSGTNISVVQNFAGNNTLGEPPDNGTSVSNGNYIVNTVNVSIRIYDTLGNSLASSKSLNTFFGKSPFTYLFDPRVIYDAYLDRFIVLMGENGNRLDIAFSQTNNPLGNWNVYTLQVDTFIAGNNDVFDYPYPMVTEHELVISGLMRSANYVGDKIIQIKKADGYNGFALNTRIWQDIVDIDGNPSGNVCAVNFAQQGSPYGVKSYFVGRERIGSRIYMYEITDTLDGTPVMNKYGFNSIYRTIPFDVSQKGSSIRLSPADNKIQNAIYLNGAIHFAYHADIQGAGYSSICYNRIDVNNKILTTSTYAQTGNTNYCFPSLASFSTDNQNKSVVMCYLESNENLYPSVKAILCDNDMNWSFPITVKAGTSYIGGTVDPHRWGDYTSCVRVHNASSPTVWVSGQYGASGNYKTWIAQIKESNVAGEKEDMINNTDVLLYPNPVISNFNFEINTPRSKKMIINLYDVTGRLVKELFNGWIYAGETKLSFNKNALPKGLYLLKIMDEEKIIKSEKIVVE